MTDNNNKRKPPKGLSRLFFRAPILVYSLGLGGLFGQRMLLLKHTGRKSGLERKAVIEVVNHDPSRNSYIVGVGFGKKTDWYQNLKAQPHATIIVGNKETQIQAVELDTSTAREVMLSYAKEHPAAAKVISGYLGYQGDGSDEDWRKVGELMTFMRFSPKA